MELNVFVQDKMASKVAKNPANKLRRCKTWQSKHSNAVSSVCVCVCVCVCMPGSGRCRGTTDCDIIAWKSARLEQTYLVRPDRCRVEEETRDAVGHPLGGRPRPSVAHQVRRSRRRVDQILLPDIDTPSLRADVGRDVSARRVCWYVGRRSSSSDIIHGRPSVGFHRRKFTAVVRCQRKMRPGRGAHRRASCDPLSVPGYASRL